MKRRVPIIRHAGRRKSEFERPEAAFARWQGRGAFKGVADDVLRDYISSGLIERSDGIWELACDPKWEQIIYTAQQQNVFKAARHLPDNSVLIYAGGRSSISTKGSRRAMQKARPNMNVEFDKDLRHLFPFIQTDRASEVLDKVIRASRK